MARIMERQMYIHFCFATSLSHAFSLHLCRPVRLSLRLLISAFIFCNLSLPPVVSLSFPSSAFVVAVAWNGGGRLVARLRQKSIILEILDLEKKFGLFLVLANDRNDY